MILYEKKALTMSFLFSIFLSIITQSGLAQMSPGSIPLPNMQTVEPTQVHIARYFSVDGNVILWGNKEGLRLYDVSKKTVLDYVLNGQQVKAIAVSRSNYKSAIVSTSNGQVFLVSQQDAKLNMQKIEDLSKEGVGVIRGALFHPKTPSKVVAVDDKRIYRSIDGGLTWDIQDALQIARKEHHNRFIMPSLMEPDSFLLSTTDHGRYIVSWEHWRYREIPEKTVPHGYTVKKNGRSYLLIGENSKYLNFKYLDLHITDAIIVGSDVYATGIGKSPVKRAFNSKNRVIDVIYLNQRLSLTFSVDVHLNNTSLMMITSPEGLHVSISGGQKWITI